MDVATRYKLLETIGAGSFATVYRAQDQELGREVAVKQIHAQFLADTNQFERYWKEATLLASFQHPHIVTIYDVVRKQGWLILELMQANLRDRLQGRVMDVKAVQTTLTQSLRALSALHSRGLLHGDIKPSNLMIDHRKRIKVGDFGLARRVSHDDGSVIRGTAKYMAPETLSHDFGDVGPHSDLYSLGFTAYELMCGSKFDTLFPGLDAFGRDRQAAWMMWHAAMDRRVPPPAKALENVPDNLASVIARLIEKDPRKRYLSADQALEDLGTPSTEGPSRSTQSVSSDLPRTTTQPAGNKRPLVIAAACVSLATSLGLLFWNPEAPQEQPLKTISTPRILRKSDPQSMTLELIDPGSGLPEELTLPEKPVIRLHSAGQTELVLLKQLEPGDWVMTRNDEGKLRVEVSRPQTHEGSLAAVDALANHITLAIENQRLRDKVELTVPSGARIRLNGEQATLRDLATDDRLSVDHLLDPAGNAGQIVSRLDAYRDQQVTGTVAGIDVMTGQLQITTDPSALIPRKFKLAPNVAVTFEDGSPAQPSDLQGGQTITLVADEFVKRISIRREQEIASGVVSAIDLTQRQLTLQSGAIETVVRFAPTTRITLQEQPATLEDLRAGNDRVSVIGGTTDQPEVIRATRPPRYDRSVLSIGCSLNKDRTIPLLLNAVEQARQLQAIAGLRYAAPAEWNKLLAEPTKAEVLEALQPLMSLRANVQQVLVIRTRAFLLDGKPVLAFADYQPNNGLTSGLLLEDLVKTLDASPSTSKLLILDLMHPLPGLDDGLPATAQELLSTLPAAISTVVFCGPPVTEPAGNPASFPSLMQAVTSGLSGQADTNRDLQITPDELDEWLRNNQKLQIGRWPVATAP